MPKPGFYNISNDDYHNNPEYAALSKSGISQLLKSPAHFKIQVPQTPAMRFGSVTHTAVLEHDKFLERYPINPSPKQIVNGVEKLAPKDREHIEGMCSEILNNPEHETARNLITADGPVEESIFWKDPEYGFMCKIRPDKRIPKIKAIVDLKTCYNASPDAFKRDIFKYRYDVQAKWYLNGINAAQDETYELFYLVAVEKTPPYKVAVYVASEETLEYGQEKINKVLPVYAECLEKDVWPGYTDKIIEM